MRCLRVCPVVGDHLPEIARVVGMATEWPHQYGDASLVLHDQGEHHVIEVRAMISAVALGDMDDMFIGLLPTVLAAIDVRAGALEMGNGGRSPEVLGRGGGNERVEFRHAIVVEGIQGAPQRIIIEVRGVASRRGRLGRSPAPVPERHGSDSVNTAELAPCQAKSPRDGSRAWSAGGGWRLQAW